MSWSRSPPRVIFFATGLRMRLAFVPVLLLLFLLNVGYTISAVAVMDRPNVGNWIATSWYMAVTVMFFAMVVSEDTAARLDMLRRGLIVGAHDRVGGGACRLFQPRSPAGMTCSRSMSAPAAPSRTPTCSARS